SVPGPADATRLAAVSRSGRVVVRQGLDGSRSQPPAGFQSLWPLDGNHARLPRRILDDHRLRTLVSPYPCKNFFTIGGVDHHAPAVWPAVDQDVVEDAAVLVADQAIADLPLFERDGVVGKELLNQVDCKRSRKPEPAHVADVEQPGRRADCLVFLDD